MVQLLERMPVVQREAWIWKEVLEGNVPGWNRKFIDISFSQTLNSSNYSVTLRVLPDYLALGSDEDYFLCPVTPLLAQRLADRLGCVLPTRKIVNLVWTNATVKLNPEPISPTAQMITVPVFADHNRIVFQQRSQHTNAHPLGALVSGHKKDVVISSKIYTNFATTVRKPVVIYGWHYLSGQPIQPLYNGHGEGYADYSHGARFIHGRVAISGLEMHVTNVLTDPALSKLLHDETASDGSTNGTIAVPRYQTPGTAPMLLQHPRSSSVFPGGVLLLSAIASGNEPLQWSWTRENQLQDGLAGATVAISNATPDLAGAWRVIVRNDYGSVTSRAAVVQVGAATFPILFCEDFEHSKPERWIEAWGAMNGLPDYTADLSFDHSLEPVIIHDLAELIPPAPHSDPSASHAARLTVNSQDSIGAIAAANVFLKQAFSNDFAVSFDCWINYPGGPGGINSTGSTQHAMFGLNHSAALPAWSGSPSSDGCWFAMSGEGGDSRDYRAFQGSPAGTTELIGLASGLTASNHIAPLYGSLFPAERFESRGAPGKQWVRVRLEHSNNIITWLCDGIALAVRTNTSPYYSGSVMIGIADFFASIANPARDSFVLFDNLAVEDLSGKTRILQTRCADGRIEVLFSAIPGRSYRIHFSDDLVSWTGSAILTSICGPIIFLDSIFGAARFYRIEGPLPE